MNTSFAIPGSLSFSTRPRGKAALKNGRRPFRVVAGVPEDFFLEKFTTNITALAKENAFHPIIGRSTEMSLVHNVLLKRTKRNPLLVGDAGVGKTAIVEELARSIATDKDVHQDLVDSDILQLDIASLMAGTKMRGEMEERVSQLLAIITSEDNERNIILFIDEIHTLVKSNDGGSSSSTESEISICDMMKPLLARGEIQCIGATTREEYVKYFKKDPAFDRRFQYIEVSEPNAKTTMEMVYAIKPVYEEFHQCYITNEAISLSVALSQQYVPYRNFPDKAIDLIDEACSRVVLSHYRTNAPKVVDVVDIQHVVGMMTDLDISHISISDRDKINLLKRDLQSKIIGQPEAIETVIKTLSRYSCGLYKQSRPICSMLFVGPTGVGKTELTKLLTKGYYGNDQKLIRFDMSEYMEDFSVSTLIGSPPGYEGYSEGGKLTTAIKENPCAVVLFDEIEKAHPEVLNLLLQVLEDGLLTDSFGRHYSFRNAMIVMTSNVAGSTDNRSLGFVTDTDARVAVDRKAALTAAFRPEFLNRIDEIVHFHMLDESHLRAICEVCLHEALQRVPSDVRVHVTEETKKAIVETASFQTEYGARPIKRLIEEVVIDKLSDFLLRRTDETHEIVI